MMAGGLGTMAATLPVEWSLSVMSWQGLFFWLTGFCLASAAILLMVVPERAATPTKATLAEQFRITGAVLTDRFYWRIQPLMAIQQLAFIGSISLRIGPWLRDVGGFAGKAERADIQLYTAAVMTLGFALSGVVSNAFHRVGVSSFVSVGITSTLFAGVCGWLAYLPSFHPAAAWMAFGFLGALPIQYMPLLVASFPAHYAGRVSTSTNFVVLSLSFAGQ